MSYDGGMCVAITNGDLCWKSLMSNIGSVIDRY
jgi:hypothetical protein